MEGWRGGGLEKLRGQGALKFSVNVEDVLVFEVD